MTNDLLGAARVRALLEAHGATPKRSLGQNFVIDPNTIRKVVEVAGLSRDDRVLEIGAGCGSLTLGLAAAAGHVLALEVDDRLVKVLEEVLSNVDNVTVVHADARSIDLAGIDANVMVGNLPYNIATFLVLRALQEAPRLSRVTVMTQREVGERLAAGPGSKVYGQTSVMLRYFGDAEVAARISRRAFYPVPNVDSVLVRVTRKPPPPVNRDRLFSLVRAAFSQRRKTLRNTVGRMWASPDDAAHAFASAGISPSARAEELSFADFVALAEVLP